MIKVSVIIPVYNTQKYVKECLDSVIRNQFDDVEIICINDGSTDQSEKILEQYKKLYSNVNVITQENRGLSCARNKGIEMARGEYIFFLDSDDYIEENALMKLYTFAANSMLDIVYFDAAVKYESNALKENIANGSFSYARKMDTCKEITGLQMLEQMQTCGSYKTSVCLQLFRKEFLDANKILFVENLLHEDHLFSFESILLAKRVGYLKESFYIRRIRDDSITTKKQTWKNFWDCFFSCMQMKKLIEKYANSISDDEITSLYQLIEGLLKYTRNIYRFGLSKEERAKRNTLSVLDRLKVQELVVCWIEQQEQMIRYTFPYYLMAPNSKIILYGAGKVGCSYYTQIKNNGYAEIVRWVDRNYEKLLGQGLPIGDTCLKEDEFDYVIIAVQDKLMAEEIKKELLEQDIPLARIIWCGKEGFNRVDEQSRRLTNRLDIYNQLIEGTNKKFFLFMSPEHGNLGDYAIALAERNFIKRYFSEYPLIEVTSLYWLNNKEEYKRIVSPNDIVAISGGGYLGNLWQSGQIMKEIVSEFPENQKILFPNTLTYINNDEVEMERDAEFFRKQNNLLIMARDKASYDRLLKYHYQQQNKIHLYPDMALSLNYSENIVERKGIGLCLRDDVERILSEEEIDKILETIKERNMNYVKTEMHLHKRVQREIGESEVQRKIDEFKKYELVITDRLHGMIFAAISATPCIAFDNATHKVFGVYEWIESLPYIKICTNLNEFRQKLCELDTVLSCKYDYKMLDGYYEAMAKCIREELEC